jgi:hypothetical protein
MPAVTHGMLEQPQWQTNCKASSQEYSKTSEELIDSKALLSQGAEDATATIKKLAFTKDASPQVSQGDGQGDEGLKASATTQDAGAAAASTLSTIQSTDTNTRGTSATIPDASVITRDAFTTNQDAEVSSDPAVQLLQGSVARLLAEKEELVYRLAIATAASLQHEPPVGLAQLAPPVKCQAIGTSPPEPPNFESCVDQAPESRFLTSQEAGVGTCGAIHMQQGPVASTPECWPVEAPPLVPNCPLVLHPVSPQEAQTNNGLASQDTSGNNGCTPQNELNINDTRRQVVSLPVNQAISMCALKQQEPFNFDSLKKQEDCCTTFEQNRQSLCGNIDEEHEQFHSSLDPAPTPTSAGDSAGMVAESMRSEGGALRRPHTDTSGKGTPNPSDPGHVGEASSHSSGHDNVEGCSRESTPKCYAQRAYDPAASGLQAAVLCGALVPPAATGKTSEEPRADTLHTGVPTSAFTPNPIASQRITAARSCVCGSFKQIAALEAAQQESTRAFSQTVARISTTSTQLLCSVRNILACRSLGHQALPPTAVGPCSVGALELTGGQQGKDWQPSLVIGRVTRGSKRLRALAALNDQLAAENTQLLQEAAALRLAAAEASATDFHGLPLALLGVPAAALLRGKWKLQLGSSDHSSIKHMASAAIARQHAASRLSGGEKDGAQQSCSQSEGALLDLAAPCSTQNSCLDTTVSGSGGKGGLLDISTWALQAVSADAMFQRHQNGSSWRQSCTQTLDMLAEGAVQSTGCCMWDTCVKEVSQGTPISAGLELSMLKCRLDAAEAQVMEVNMEGAHLDMLEVWLENGGVDDTGSRIL